MNILFICDEYPPGRHGGIGTSVQLLARQLVREGHAVYVTGLYSWSYRGADSEIDQGVFVSRLRYGPNFQFVCAPFAYFLFDFLPGIIKRHVNGRKAFAAFLNHIGSLIDEKGIDIIEIADWNTFSLKIGFRVSWPDFKIPLVLKSHGSYTYFQHETDRFAKSSLVRLDSMLFERADYMTAVSKYVADANKMLFDLEKPSTILYNGVVFQKVSGLKPRSKNKVLFSGSLARKKGVYELMMAWNRVCREYPEAELHLYGKGSTFSLKRRVARQFRNKVVFHGHVDREVILRGLSEAAVAVFPSFSETFGMAAVESMSMGCPTIFTKRSSGPEIIRNGIDGILVDPAHPDEIATAILKLLNDERLASAMASSGYNRAKELFDIENIARIHVDYYEDAIRGFRAGHS